MRIGSLCYACPACIRGHRSSSCTHTAQMQALRPRGRPRSACDACRARREKGMAHSKCRCKEKQARMDMRFLLNPAPLTGERRHGIKSQ